MAKDIREIDKSVDEASFKMKLAELMSALADAQVALADAKIEVSELRAEIAGMQAGESCPKCRTGRLSVVSVDQSQHQVGYEFHVSKCDEEACGYANKRTFSTAERKYV
ncbi:hypothetical protein [Tateyamaria sp. SN3-11]|uniref:hypothetical protein n=1 Tax=Tateyamaria sp. SN3-11 TaxID=3092147 RepID=UPI0039E9C495